jgi:hypothetical protein
VVRKTRFPVLSSLFGFVAAVPFFPFLFCLSVGLCLFRLFLFSFLLDSDEFSKYVLWRCLQIGRPVIYGQSLYHDKFAYSLSNNPRLPSPSLDQLLPLLGPEVLVLDSYNSLSAGSFGPSVLELTAHSIKARQQQHNSVWYLPMLSRKEYLAKKQKQSEMKERDDKKDKMMETTRADFSIWREYRPVVISTAYVHGNQRPLIDAVFDACENVWFSPLQSHSSKTPQIFGSSKVK